MVAISGNNEDVCECGKFLKGNGIETCYACERRLAPSFKKEKKEKKFHNKK